MHCRFANNDNDIRSSDKPEINRIFTSYCLRIIHTERISVMNSEFKTFVSCSLTAMLVLSGCAGSAAHQEPAAPAAVPSVQPASEAPAETASVSSSKSGGGSPWIDSQIPENITPGMQVSPAEDYYLSVNYEAILAGGRGTRNVQQKIAEKVRSFLTDEKADTHEMELVQQYYRSFMDWDHRNEIGAEPLRRVVEDIQGITSLKELSAFLSDSDRSRDVPLFLKMSPNADTGLTETPGKDYIVMLYLFPAVDMLLGEVDAYTDRSESSQHKLEAAEEEVKHVLKELDFSEEDAKHAFDSFFEMETLMAGGQIPMSDLLSGKYVQTYAHADLNQIAETMKDYPIIPILKARGFGNETQFMYEENGYLPYVADFYTEENLEKMKNYLLVSYVLENDWYLDYDAFWHRINREMSGSLADGSEKLDTEEVVYLFLRRDLTFALGNSYLARYDAGPLKKQTVELFRKIQSEYIDMLKNKEWLSEESRQKAIEKVEAMKFYALYPDKTIVDYSNIDFSQDDIAAIAGKLKRQKEEETIALLDASLDPEIEAWRNWDILENNAKNIREINAVLFSLGWMEQYDYEKGFTQEELYANIGTVLAHEMSHGFDALGAQFDKDGHMNSIFSEEDLKHFEERINKLESYFDQIVPFDGYHVNGASISVEATADLTGFEAIMRIAEKTENFDYDAFFRNYAENNFWLSSYEKDLDALKNDPHPLDYLRVNVIVQQFDRFLETYDVKEGDTMYLPKENRIFVW